MPIQNRLRKRVTNENALTHLSIRGNGAPFDRQAIACIELETEGMTYRIGRIALHAGCCVREMQLPVDSAARKRLTPDFMG